MKMDFYYEKEQKNQIRQKKSHVAQNSADRLCFFAGVLSRICSREAHNGSVQVRSA